MSKRIGITSALSPSDHAALRRELYGYHFFDRSRNGKNFRLARKQPTQEELGL